MIVFYDKKTLRLKEDIKILVPEAFVFKAAETQDVHEINCFSHEITPDMMDYIISQHPKLKEKFDMYEHDFIGRHGLDPEYD